MKAIILRRPKLGMTSVREVAKAARANGFDIHGLRNNLKYPQGVEMVFRWGTTSNLPYPAKITVNTSAAIHYVADKKKSRMDFAEKGLAPKSWDSVEAVLTYDMMEKPIDWKAGLIVRKSTHHQGKFLDFVTSMEELQKSVGKYAEGDYYISEFINKVAEYRVFICQGRAVWVAKKTPADAKAVAWNVAKGGVFDNVNWGDWPLKAVKVAREAFLLTDLDFGGVDVMVDEKGNAYVLEINSAPSQTSPYRQQCTSKSFQWILKNENKERIPVVEERGGYRKFIHPAVCPEAILVGGQK